MNLWTGYVNEIDYGGHLKNMLEYGEEKKNREGERKEKSFLFIIDLPVTKKNVRAMTEIGRWKIENGGFNIQKNYGYCLEHMYSRLYKRMKNDYYLIQIHHIPQDTGIMEKG